MLGDGDCNGGDNDGGKGERRQQMNESSERIEKKRNNEKHLPQKIQKFKILTAEYRIRNATRPEQRPMSSVRLILTITPLRPQSTAILLSS